jgi:hypothetical protein
MVRSHNLGVLLREDYDEIAFAAESVLVTAVLIAALPAGT